MTDLPAALHTAEEVRELDRLAMEHLGVSASTLMTRAGAAAFRHMERLWPSARRFAVVCGPGNNGGDGYVLARLAHGAGHTVDVWHVGELDHLKGAALSAYQAWVKRGEVKPFAAERLRDADLIVDAMFGTGVARPIEEPARSAIRAMNDSGRPIFAIDLPSGLNADTGQPLGEAVRADVTVTFIGLKRGLLTGRGPDHAGCLLFDPLQVPDLVLGQVASECTRFDYDTLAAHLRLRSPGAHKGDFGHLLVIGGEKGMAGAVRLAGEAGLRVGAGLVTVATREANVASVGTGRPELMVSGVEQLQHLRALLERATVIALGPGLGTGAWGHALLHEALGSGLPMIVDADALKLIAGDRELRLFGKDDWILTPHPGEASRLLARSIEAVQGNRFQAVADLQTRYRGVVVLKGPGTLVADGTAAVGLCNEGNPGLATAGTGDVLTGVIAGLVAQGYPLTVAARLGVALHARAADLAGAEGERGLLASDLFTALRPLLNPQIRPRLDSLRAMDPRDDAG